MSILKPLPYIKDGKADKPG